MPAKKHKPEEIIGKLREVEIMLGQGGTTAEACRRIAVSEQTYWWSPGSSATKMCWQPWPSCSLTGARLHISDRTTAASSSPPQSRNGSGRSA